MEMNEGSVGKVLPLLLNMVLVESVLSFNDQGFYGEPWKTVYSLGGRSSLRRLHGQ